MRPLCDYAPFILSFRTTLWLPWFVLPGDASATAFALPAHLAYPLCVRAVAPT